MTADDAKPKRNSGGNGSNAPPKLDHLLTKSAGLMAARGFSRTSIRDVANETGISLGGMYYYFQSKEDLLFLIQERTFGSLLALQEAAVAEGGSPDSRLRRLVRNHLDYFVSHFNELKVCTFELKSLQGERYDTVADLRRRYFVCLARVVGELAGLDGAEAEHDVGVRHRTLFVFGMLNWIFMWYDPERDVPVESLGDEMVAMIMHGLDGQPAGPEATES